MTIYERKKNLRTSIRSMLKDRYSDKESHIKASQIICSKIENAAFFIDSEIVLLYVPYGQEADVLPLVKTAWNMNKTVCVPRVVSGSSRMDFYILKNDVSLESQLETGSFGIREPLLSLEELVPDSKLQDKKVLVIVPGLAFTKDGKRLGKGMGFYDRYIPLLKNTGCKCFCAGVCFFEQLVEDLPVEETDCVLDAVVSPDAAVS